MNISALLILVALLASSIGDASAQSNVDASIEYEISRYNIDSINISVKDAGGSTDQLLVLSIPVSKLKIKEGNQYILGIKHSIGTSFVVIKHPTNSENISISISPEREESGNGARISQFGMGLALIVPTLVNKHYEPLKKFSGTGRLAFLDSYKKISATFREGYTVIEQNQEITLYKNTTFALSNFPKRGTSEILFRPPRSEESELVDVIFSRSVIVVLALLVSSMAPGFVPEQYLVRIVVGLTAVLLMFIGARWYFAVKERLAYAPVISDTVASVGYLIALLFLWHIRRRSANDQSRGSG